jgi:prophage regulatory protein
MTVLTSDVLLRVRDQIDRCLSKREVCNLTGMSGSTLEREVKAGRFPRPIPISRKRRAFRESDVRTWFRDAAAKTT